MITGINESKTLTKQISCKCKCKFYRTKCNSSSKSNSDKCRCEYKNPKEHYVCNLYIYIYIYIYTRVSSFHGLISVARANEYRTTYVTRVLKAPGAELCQNACGVVNEPKIFGVLLNALVKMKNI